jgi:hypothetical protein
VNELDIRPHACSAGGQVVGLEGLGSYRLAKLLPEALFEKASEQPTHRFHGADTNGFVRRWNRRPEILARAPRREVATDRLGPV